MDFLKHVENFFISSSPLSWLVAILLIGVLTFLLKIVLNYILKKLELLSHHTKVMWDDLVIDSLKSTKQWAIFSILLIPTINLMSQNEKAHRFVYGLVTILLAIQIIIWGLTALKYWRKHYLQKKLATDTSSAEALGLVATILQALFVMIVILIALSNLGVNVSALIAGLGIGGIAIALAAQNVLGDLLGSLSIVLDKPFVIGDSIVVGDKSGTVEDIGLKTTRLRATSGEQLIISNKDLLESRIHNYKKLFRRRIEKKILISHGTPVEKLKEIPEWIKAFTKDQKKLSLDRCFLEDVTETAYVFTLVFYVEDPDYNLYAALQQELYLKIITKLNLEQVDFAQPIKSIDSYKKNNDSTKL